MEEALDLSFDSLLMMMMMKKVWVKMHEHCLVQQGVLLYRTTNQQTKLTEGESTCLGVSTHSYGDRIYGHNKKP